MRHIERVQTGVRMERRMVKVLKALAEYLDMPLGELLEGIVLHACEGRLPFGSSTLEQIGRLRQVYGLEITAADSHQIVERKGARPATRPKETRRPSTKRARRK